jgi:hypothetical protein
MADPTQRQAKLAVLLREALASRHDRLDDADLAAFVGSMELSQQDIDAMLRFLARDTARIRALKSCRGQTLTPERIWTADPPPPIPVPAVESEAAAEPPTVV